MPHRYKLLFATLFVSLGFASTSHAAIFDYNKVVRDDRGQVVHAIQSGTCVRTTWQEGHDVCAPVVVEQTVTYAPPPPPPPQIVQQRVDVLSADEKTVYFPFDSAQLTPEAQRKLDTVAEKLSAASSVEGADIVGTADRFGDNHYNQKLSEQRAQAVHNYLASRGYLNTRVAANVRGVGKTQPITNCRTDIPRESQIACLGPDRRVQLQVRYVQTTVENRMVQPPPIEGRVIYSQPAPPAAAPLPPATY